LLLMRLLIVLLDIIMFIFGYERVD